MAKDIDNLWKRARVTAVIPELNQCSVKFESGRKQEVTIDIHNTLPLGESDAGTEHILMKVNISYTAILYG